MKEFKPMLASPVDLDLLQYPVLCTPKLDGIRCSIVNGKPYSRSMKPIPNKHVNEVLTRFDWTGMDGELMVKGDFNSVQSAIMKREGFPQFTFWVFDSFREDLISLHYEDRIDELAFEDYPEYIKILTPVEIEDEKELLSYLDGCINSGYEGVMIRQPGGPYKFGRSTVKEGYLLKLKRFHDDEAELVEVTEKMHNANELEQDELGYAKRSSKKENLIPAGTAGSCILRWKDIEFRVGFGPGITDEDKQQIWNARKELVGSLVKFSYQELSKDGVPRFGKSLCIRHEDDL